MLATGSLDGTVGLWDAATGEAALPPIRGHGNGVASVCFSPIMNSDESDVHHLILTGKNGSGKTSLLDALAEYLEDVCSENYKLGVGNQRHGVAIAFNSPELMIHNLYHIGDCVFAYFGAHRAFNAIVPKYIEKVTFEDHYGLHDSPRDVFVKYLLDLKMTQALAQSNGRKERAEEISRWFDSLRDMMRTVYEDRTLTIEFDEDTYQFSICQEGREPFDINNTSDGFSAILDIVVGIMLRMVSKSGRTFRFDLPGIVLVDEIESHLHLSLQKRIVPYLTELFPNIQFVLTTHSPFVLSSVRNAVIYDLENHILITDGLSNNTYESIVEGYFNVDLLSAELRQKYDRYEELANKDELTDDELLESGELELYLDEIPDYLALGITTEYQKLKLQLYAKVVDE